jgi:hypothetical protein
MNLEIEVTLSPVLSIEELEKIWQQLHPAFLKEGAEAVLKFVETKDSAVARNQVLRFAIRKIGGATGASSSDLDGMIIIGDAAIANAMAAAEQDAESTALWIDEGNISAFNLSANLCDCWGDGDSRHAQHFAAGLRYADLALELRVELKKGPGPFSMAHWVRGKHLLSLKRPNDAAAAFSSSLACERDLARAKGITPIASAQSPASLLSSQAFMGYAQVQSGNKAGLKLFEEAQGFLKIQSESLDKDVSSDALSFLQQLAETALRS